MDTPQKLQLARGLVGDWKNKLYQEVNLLRSLQLFNSQKKKPLANGFEFGVDTDANLAIFQTRNGKREVKGAKTEFNLKLNHGYGT